MFALNGCPTTKAILGACTISGILASKLEKCNWECSPESCCQVVNMTKNCLIASSAAYFWVKFTQQYLSPHSLSFCLFRNRVVTMNSKEKKKPNVGCQRASKPA